MNIISRILSTLLHPLLMPVYGIFIIFFHTYLLVLNLPFKLFILAGVFLFTCIIPALCIYILYKIKAISSVTLNDRKDRLYPYIICQLSYISCCRSSSATAAIMGNPGLFLGAAISVIISIIINRWWKISAHLAGIGGVVALIYFLTGSQLMLPSFPLFLIVLWTLLAGALGSARIYMGRHTLGQVLAGFANGFFWVYICTAFLLKYQL